VLSIGERKKLIKIAAMLSSTFDGERASAAAKVSSILKKAGLTWEDVIRSAGSAKADPPPRQQHGDDPFDKNRYSYNPRWRGHRTPSDDFTLFRAGKLLRAHENGEIELSKREYEFVRDLTAYDNLYHYSVKQTDWVNRIWDDKIDWKKQRTPIFDDGDST
jgi:hypothetical protein